MNATPTDALTGAEVQRLLLQKDPGALLVPPRILHRVIKTDRGLTGPGLQVPHRKSYVVERQRLLHIADLDELNLEPGLELPPVLLLFPRPDPQRLAARERSAALLRYWRMLFHARIHLAFLQARSASDRSNRPVRSRIERIGLTEFNEATAVLKQEAYLLPPGDTATAYEEFAALYLELRYFAPHMLPLYFPACARLETIDGVLAEDVDAASLFAATRLEGAADPAPPSVPALADEREILAQSEEEITEAPTLELPMEDAPRTYLRLLGRADKASAQGNRVRAAIFRMRAAALAPSGQANPTRAAAYRELEQFSKRLQKTLDYADEAAADWRQALFALLEPASRGIWPSESRLLYDLQKACVDRERPVYAVDLVEWLVSWGRRPIKRLLPFHDSVRVVKHLRSATHRLITIRIPEAIRRRLIELLIEATHHAQHRLRERLRPVLRDALTKVDLAPHNIAEEVARDKVVEELIDLVVEHGFLRLSDLRDAIARNRLKLPDLTGENGAATVRERGNGMGVRSLTVAAQMSWGRGIRSFFLGDQLIRANRRLATDLDGVYHRGEIYLRWLQRFSAAAFGTVLGRLLTLYIALPFGCALALLKVWDELLEHLPGGAPAESESAHEAAKHINPYAFTLLGLFFLAVFHIRPFRNGLLWASVKTGHGLLWMLRELPVRFLHLPWVASILQSKPWLFFYQYVLKPLPVAVLAALIVSSSGGNLFATLAMGTGMLVAGSMLLNSRWGLFIQETAADRMMRTWHLIHADLVPGLVRWVLYLYRRLQEEVERLIYTVDEWLRFRPGDNRLSLYSKPALGLIWFGVTYIFRVIFNLFVEPTINPIKHFPTVTVTAKLILPIYRELFSFFLSLVEPVLGQKAGYPIAATAIFFLPGLAGFLVWEFKENWRLYRANQAPTLHPEIVGHHGETVLQLMRPGMHSGTLPKLYARLRHGRGRSPRRQYEALHHLRERLRQFVERNLFAILAGSKSWGDSLRLRVGEIHIATNRIRIELVGPAESIHIDFEEHSGWLLSGLTCSTDSSQSWLSRLTAEQNLTFRDALGGFYKRAGVDVVREQMATQLPPGSVFDMSKNGFVVWPPSGRNGAVVYDRGDGPEMLPRAQGHAAISPMPHLNVESVFYSATPIRWSAWVQTWQRDHDGKGHVPLLPMHVRLLPMLRQDP